MDDPACLQRMWFRIHGDELRMNVHMRSNDAFKAAFMNMWAFTALQQFVAEAVSRRARRTLRPGAYAHIADSFHIYGSYFREFEGFLNSVRKRSFRRAHLGQHQRLRPERVRVGASARLRQEQETRSADRR